jgi:hypothetical protein
LKIIDLQGFRAEVWTTNEAGEPRGRPLWARTSSRVGGCLQVPSNPGDGLGEHIGQGVDEMELLVVGELAAEEGNGQ